jgi:hypothetical protein
MEKAIVYPMKIYSDSQLVPYHQGPVQIRPFRKVSPRVVPADVNPAVKRYAQMSPPRISRNPTQADVHDSVYQPDRRLEIQKMNKVGLIVDIYT